MGPLQEQQVVNNSRLLLKFYILDPPVLCSGTIIQEKKSYFSASKHCSAMIVNLICKIMHTMWLHRKRNGSCFEWNGAGSNKITLWYVLSPKLHEERVYFEYFSRSQYIIEESQNRNKYRNLKEKPQKNSAFWITHRLVHTQLPGTSQDQLPSQVLN